MVTYMGREVEPALCRCRVCSSRSRYAPLVADRMQMKRIVFLSASAKTFITSQKCFVRREQKAGPDRIHVETIYSNQCSVSDAPPFFLSPEKQPRQECRENIIIYTTVQKFGVT